MYIEVNCKLYKCKLYFYLNNTYTYAHVHTCERASINFTNYSERN